MPNKNKVSDETRAKVLVKASEILAARIRFNQALLDEYRAASEEQLQEIIGAMEKPFMLIDPLLSKHGMPERGRNRLTPDKHQERVVQPVATDIAFLTYLEKILLKSVTDNDALLYLAFWIDTYLKENKPRIEPQLEFFDEVKSKIYSAIRVAKRADDKKKLGELQIELDIVIKARASHKVYINNNQEIYPLEEIQSLLIDTRVFGNLERDFFDKYTEMFAFGNHINTRVNDEFDKLKEQNIKLCVSLVKKYNEEVAPFKDQGIPQAFIDILTEIDTCRVKLKEHNISSKKIILLSMGDFDKDEVLESGRLHFYYSEKIRQLMAELTQVSKEEKNWQAEQERIAAQKSKEQKEQIEKAKAVKAAQDAAVETAKAENKAKLEEESKRLDEITRQQKAEREKQHKLDFAARNAQRKIEKEEKETNKRLARQKLFAEARQLEIIPESGKLRSRFILDDQIIKDNYHRLCDIMDPSRKKFRYRDVMALLNDLGGELVTATKSSHQRIQFNGVIYQEIDFVEAELPTTVTAGGIARPHAGETELRNHNLYLLQQALDSVLPNDWQNKYLPRAKPDKLTLS